MNSGGKKKHKMTLHVMAWIITVLSSGACMKYALSVVGLDVSYMEAMAFWLCLAYVAIMIHDVDRLISGIRRDEEA